MSGNTIGRRTFLGTSALAITAALPASAQSGDGGDAFRFEIERTDEEWRERLTEDEFEILRRGGTEAKKSSPLWDEARPGMYSCKACDLALFDAHWKEMLDIGWVFFRQCEPLAILTRIDRPNYQEAINATETTMAPELSAEELRALDTLAGVAATCRRCGSHLGHIVSIKNKVLYCINGAAMNFTAEEA